MSQLATKYQCQASRRCKERRAIVEIDGTRYRARSCVRHLPTRLRSHVVSTQLTASEQASENQCGARRRNGEPCTKPKGFGTDHPGYGRCKFHGGAHINGRKAAAKEEAADQAYVMGLPIDVDPMDALLACVRIAAGEVAYASIQIKTLEADEAVVTAESRKVRPLSLGKDGEDEDTPVEEVTTSNDARLHVWIRTRHDAMDRLAKYSKMAIDAGVAERKVELAEKIGGMIGRMIQGVLGELDLNTEQQRRAPEIVQRHLTVIESSAHQLEEAAA